MTVWKACPIAPSGGSIATTSSTCSARASTPPCTICRRLRPPKPPEGTEIKWRDPPLGEIALPRGVLRLTLGPGSGLGRRPGDPQGRFWGVGDRGPNLKIPAAVDDYGLLSLEPLRALPGAKVLPAPAIGPILAEL